MMRNAASRARIGALMASSVLVTRGVTAPAPVIAEPSCSGVTSSGSKVPTSWPRRMTSIRSDRPISSSRSAEISSTASPLRRAALMWPQIAAWAPTSTPRVGWAAISRIGSLLISRPTISFCWLPPDSARASTSGPGVRTSYSLMIRSVSLRAKPLSISPYFSMGGRLW